MNEWIKAIIFYGLPVIITIFYITHYGDYYYFIHPISYAQGTLLVLVGGVWPFFYVGLDEIISKKWGQIKFERNMRR